MITLVELGVLLYIAKTIKLYCAAHSNNNKHLMTGPKGNSEFCFPETLNVPRGEAEGNIEVEGKQNSLFPEGPVVKCFVIPPNSN